MLVITLKKVVVIDTCDSSSERGSYYSNTSLEKPMETKDYAVLSNSKIRKEREQESR